MQRPRTPGEADPFSEPPVEVLAEIQAGLDGIYGPPVEGDDELGPEIKLTTDQLKMAALYHLALNTDDERWYKPPEDDPANDDLEYRRGILAGISIATGIRDDLVKEALNEGANQGFIKLESKKLRRNATAITNVQVTQLFRDTLDDLKANQPEAIEALDNYFLQDKRRAILFVRKEINNEREVFGIDEPYVFDELSVFQSLAELEEHLAWLNGIQADLEFMIPTKDEDFVTLFNLQQAKRKRPDNI